MKEKKLTNLQRKFYKEYLKDKNTIQAAIRAGYSKKYAEKNSYKLLGIDWIKKQLEKHEAKIIEKENEDIEYERKRIKDEFKKLAFSDITKFKVRISKEKFENPDGTGYLEYKTIVKAIDKDGKEIDADGAAVSEINISKSGFKFKLHDKRGALEDLARIYGMFTDKLEIDANVGVKIINDIQ